MPIYAFECAACAHSFDRLQKLSDADPATCPACGAPQVRRRVTAPSFRLAGSGWYETDFKGDKDKRRNLAGDSAGTASGGGTAAPGAADGAGSKAAAKPVEGSSAKPATPAPKSGD